MTNVIDKEGFMMKILVTFMAGIALVLFAVNYYKAASSSALDWKQMSVNSHLEGMRINSSHELGVRKVNADYELGLKKVDANCLVMHTENHQRKLKKIDADMTMHTERLAMIRELDKDKLAMFPNVGRMSGWTFLILNSLHSSIIICNSHILHCR